MQSHLLAGSGAEDLAVHWTLFPGLAQYALSPATRNDAPVRSTASVDGGATSSSMCMSC